MEIIQDRCAIILTYLYFVMRLILQCFICISAHYKWHANDDDDDDDDEGETRWVQFHNHAQ